MLSLYQPEAAIDIVQRLNQLQKNTPRQWGKMNAAQMLWHVNAILEISLGMGNSKPNLLGKLLGPFLKKMVLNTVEVAVIAGQFGVAENGAVWVTEEQLKVRALPFIAQNLVILLHESQLVHNMQQAYDRIGQASYGYGVFIAGPSKTADIEQSLVLGAHGAKSLTILIHS